MAIYINVKKYRGNHGTLHNLPKQPPSLTRESHHLANSGYGIVLTNIKCVQYIHVVQYARFDLHIELLLGEEVSSHISAHCIE